ncbi:hypothetical protein WKI40_00925 [Kosakonia sacchari]
MDIKVTNGCIIIAVK